MKHAERDKVIAYYRKTWGFTFRVVGPWDKKFSLEIQQGKGTKWITWETYKKRDKAIEAFVIEIKKDSGWDKPI